MDVQDNSSMKIYMFFFTVSYLKLMDRILI